MNFMIISFQVFISWGYLVPQINLIDAAANSFSKQSAIALT